jgi:site-specific DNA-methyltransferase (adenine-specific)/modification methylase
MDPAHPTQKPLRVLRHLLKLATQPGNVVFDPFMGVGSTGVTALELGRRFIGAELDRSYFDAATQRIRDMDAQLPLQIDLAA